MIISPPSAVEVFYSYAHADESLRNALEKHLKTLQRQGLITQWHDRRIDAGTEWAQVIDVIIRLKLCPLASVNCG